mgnify:FL=1
MEPRQMQPSPFRQTNAFAMNYALPYGIYWIIGMLCFVNSLNNSLFSLVFYFVFASTPVIGYMLLCRFRERVCDGVISFGRGYLFSLLLYFYAALLLAAACYVYFQFFDHGAFIDQYLQMLNSPEVKQAFEQESMKQLTDGRGLDDIKDIMEKMQSIPPVTYAANLLDINIFLGLVLSLPASLLAVRKTAQSKQ